MSKSSYSIAIDARAFNTKRLSGIPRYVWRLVLYLANKPEINLHLFCCEGVSLEDFNFSEAQKRRVKIVNLKTIDYSPSNANQALDREFIPKYLIDNKISLYHLCSNWGLQNKLPIPTLLTIHDVIPFSIREGAYLDDETYKIYKENIAKSARYSDKITTISEFSKEKIVETLEVDPGKIEVIFNGVEKPIVPSREDTLRVIEKLDLKKDKFFLSLGGFHERKNSIKSLEAFLQFSKEFPDFKIVFPGNNISNSYVKAQFNKFKKVAGSSNKIICPGFITDMEKEILIRESRAVIYPSLYEGFGLPVLETMVREKPILCSNTTALPEVGGNVPYYFNPESVSKISDSMKAVTKEDNDLSEKIKKGKEKSKIYTWENAFDKLWHLYQALIDIDQ